MRWLDPGPLVDGDLQLVLRRRCPEDLLMNWCPAYQFDMVHVRTGRRMGVIDLRIGHTHHLTHYGGHIGYEVSAPYRGHHYAARAVKLILNLARQHLFETVWITCNPDNIASRRTCEIAGGVFVEIVDLPEDTDMYQEGERQKCRYRFDIAG